MPRKRARIGVYSLSSFPTTTLALVLSVLLLIGTISNDDGVVSAFQPVWNSETTEKTVASSALFGFGTNPWMTNDAPPLCRNPARKVCLMVEPTPFTQVSGYANRFQEMLTFMSKAGDDVDTLTVDNQTPAMDLPTHYLGYPIRHTHGFTFPLYNQISLSLDLPEMKGARMIETFQPDLIHVTSPGFLLLAAIFYARVMKIPLVMSYHTHLPTYGTYRTNRSLNVPASWTYSRRNASVSVRTLFFFLSHTLVVVSNFMIDS
jgi:hypothetical protein